MAGLPSRRRYAAEFGTLASFATIQLLIDRSVLARRRRRRARVANGEARFARRANLPGLSWESLGFFLNRRRPLFPFRMPPSPAAENEGFFEGSGWFLEKSPNDPTA